MMSHKQLYFIRQWGLNHVHDSGYVHVYDNRGLHHVNDSYKRLEAFKTFKNTYVQSHEKTNNLHMRNRRRRIAQYTQLSESAVAAQLISTFVFATQIVQSPFFLNPKFQASSLLLWMYRPVCVRPGRNPNC